MTELPTYFIVISSQAFPGSSNNKPLVTEDGQAASNRKKAAFASRDTKDLKRQGRGWTSRTRTVRLCGTVCPVLLSPVRHLSLSLSKILIRWKTSCIVPVPKKGRVKGLDDFRSIVLTSQVMKCFERTILELLALQVRPSQDPCSLLAGREWGAQHM